MKTKNKAYVNEANTKELKLTNEEIRSIEIYKNLSEEELDELRDFIYNISIVLYKAFQNE